ncbi:MAG: hypothetical protein WC886_06225 [Saccharofermentanaceae bacterium]|jgi:hypothetical protein
MNISFDFDGCLNRLEVQDICKNHIVKGDNVRITTSRWKNPNAGNNNDLLMIASNLGISNIIYTNHQPKCFFMNGIDIHYDDNPDEEINMECKFILI